MKEVLHRIRAIAPRRIDRLLDVFGITGSRPARVAVVTVFLAVGLFVGMWMARPRPVADWAPFDVIESRTPLQELPVDAVPPGTATPVASEKTYIDLEGLEELVVGVDLDYLDGNAFSYEIIVRDFTEMVVHEEEIPELYVNDGRFLLRLHPGRLDEGTYTLEVVAHEADGPRVAAITEFEILK